MPDSALSIAWEKAELAVLMAEIHHALAHAAVVIAETEELFAALDRSREERASRRLALGCDVVVGADGVTRAI